MRSDLRQAGLTLLQKPGQPGREAVGPGALEEHPADSRVPRLCDAAATDPVAGRVLAGNEAEVGHELARGLEAAHIPDLGRKGDGSQERDTPKGLVGFDHRRHRPGGDHLGDLPSQPLEPRFGSTFALLVLTKIASLILGMGLSTVAAYVVLAVLAAPALAVGDIDPIAAH